MIYLKPKTRLAEASRGRIVNLIPSSRQVSLLNDRLKSKSGFTIVELMVVITIMVLILTAFLLNLNAGRSARNLNIALNQLVTNIRKVQSYTLSGRNITPGLTADYYVMKFDYPTTTSYTIQAIYNTTSTPTVTTVETVKLPPGITFSGVATITRPGSLVPSSYASSCALLAYKLPFGRILMNNGCDVNIAFPDQDDYVKIVNFVSNTDNYTVSSDSNLSVILTNDKKATKTVTVYGSTGRVDFQ